jgi:hypothetical protein
MSAQTAAIKRRLNQSMEMKWTARRSLRSRSVSVVCNELPKSRNKEVEKLTKRPGKGSFIEIACWWPNARGMSENRQNPSRFSDSSVISCTHQSRSGVMLLQSRPGLPPSWMSISDLI